MPRGDRMGPLGMGSRSGRGAGHCAGFDVPGFANPRPGRGRGWGFGRGGGGWRHGLAWGGPLYGIHSVGGATVERARGRLEQEGLD
jgi:hypothetical protein